jgi:hypothetical protein
VGLDWRLADLVTQETYNEVKNSAGVSGVIYGVPVGANYSDYKNRVDKLKKEYTEQLSYTQQLNIAWSGLDPKSENLYRDCLNTQVLTTDGLHAVVVGATKTDIAILVSFSVPGKLKTSVNWVGVPSEWRSLFPKSLKSGRLMVIVPRPNKEISVAGNAPGYATKQIVLEPLPPPPPDLTPKWVNFTHANIPTKDGSGNVVGTISGITFLLLSDPQGTGKAPYKFKYDYYNGSGTWRGSQTIFVELLDPKGLVLDTLKFALDRGKCVYGKAEPRPQPDGTTNVGSGTFVKNIRVQTNAVSGKQTGC